MTLLLTTACAAGTSPALSAALEPARAIGLTIDCASPCKTEWERAQFWLAQHSIARTRAATDVRLETEHAVSITGFDAVYGFVILREPITADVYRISMLPVCVGGMRGCSPKEEDVRTAFLYYVSTGKDVLTGHDGGALKAYLPAP